MRLMRLPGVDRVQRADDEVPRLGGGDGDFRRLAVAQLTDEDHLRRFAQRRAQADGERGKIVAQLPLAERRGLVRMHELDGVFQRDDVAGQLFVELVEQRGQRRRLAGAGRAGDEDEARFFRRSSCRRWAAG